MRYRVDVKYNVTKDEVGRPLGMLDCGDHGSPFINHTFKHITTLELEAENMYEACERVFRLMNVVDGTEAPVRLKVRSMNVGDILVVVAIDTRKLPRLFACRDLGFEDVTEGAEFAGGVKQEVAQ